MSSALVVLCVSCLLPRIEQFRFVVGDGGPEMIRKAFEVSADGTFVWREDNPMYPKPKNEVAAEIRSAVSAHALSPFSSLETRSASDLLSPEFKARQVMWNMIRNKYDGEQQIRARGGLELPSLPHMKGSWNAYKNGQPVDACDMLEHHYRLILR